MGINVSDWLELAVNRNDWRHSVKKGCDMFEKKIGHAELKRALRKDTMTNLTDNLKSWVCGTCGRALLSKAGYVNTY